MIDVDFKLYKYMGIDLLPTPKNYITTFYKFQSLTFSIDQFEHNF